MKVRLAILLAVGTLGLAAVTDALADPPAPLAPANGATFTAGVNQIPFNASVANAAAPTPGPTHLNFLISRSPDLDANGNLDWFDIVRGVADDPTANPIVYRATTNQDDGWPNRPGHYWWQADNGECDATPNCPTRSFTIVAAPAALLAQGKVELDTFLTKRPRHRTHRHKVKFRFKSNIAGAHFRCLYAHGWSRCHSPHVFRHLRPGRYKFKAQAVVNGERDSSPATWVFRILR